MGPHLVSGFTALELLFEYGEHESSSVAQILNVVRNKYWSHIDPCGNQYGHVNIENVGTVISGQLCGKLAGTGFLPPSARDYSIETSQTTKIMDPDDPKSKKNNLTPSKEEITDDESVEEVIACVSAKKKAARRKRMMISDDEQDER